MRYLLLLVVNVAWSLWFGGTIATFVFGWYFFHPVKDFSPKNPTSAYVAPSNSVPEGPPNYAGPAASSMFFTFSKYELGLAAVAMLATGLLLATYPTKSVLGVLAALIVAGGMAVTVALGLIPQMESLRQQGKQHTDEFKKYHAKSMIAMTMQSGVLLLGGAAILLAAKPLKKDVVIERESKTDSEYEPMFDERKPRGL